MQKAIYILFLFVAILHSTRLLSQQELTQYTSDFRFHDGIYKSFEEFKRNDPSVKEQAIISENPEVQILIGNFATMQKISYYDEMGISHKLDRGEVWGYCSDGAIYVLLNNNFHRLSKIGAIIHFTESHNTFYYSRSYPVSAINRPVRLVQYMIDFNTGELLSYDLENFMLLLQADQQLYAEFNSIKGKKKKEKQMFIYLNKFNLRNPINF